MAVTVDREREPLMASNREGRGMRCRKLLLFALCSLSACLM